MHQFERHSNRTTSQIVEGEGGTSSSLALLNRYAERARARERLKCLEIADLSRSPTSVMGHEMLVRENKNIVDNFALAGAKAPSPCAVIRRGVDGSNSSAAALDNGMRNYIKRQRPAKLDLNLTLL